MTRPLIYEDSTLPIHAYLDGELDPTNALAVEKRMATDPALAADCERVDALQRLMREHLPREAPPLGLRMRVETAVGMRRPRTQLSHAQFSWRGLPSPTAVHLSVLLRHPPACRTSPAPAHSPATCSDTHNLL